MKVQTIKMDKLPADDIWMPSIHLGEHSIWTAEIAAENDVSVRKLSTWARHAEE